MNSTELKQFLDNYVYQETKVVDDGVQFMYHPDKVGMMEWLLKAGVDPNTQVQSQMSRLNRSLLGFAVHEQDEKGVNALLAAGADPSAVCSGGWNSFDFGGVFLANQGVKLQLGRRAPNRWR